MPQKGGISLPSVKDVAIETTVEVLAFMEGLIQVSGNLQVSAVAAQEVKPGDPIAVDDSTKKWIPYVDDGSGGAETAIGIVRIGGTTAKTADGGVDAPIEVIIAGAVKIDVVEAASNWHTDVITELGMKKKIPANAYIF